MKTALVTDDGRRLSLQKMEFTLRPIGIIYSPFKEKEQTPIQVTQSQAIGSVQNMPDFDICMENMRVGWYETRSKT